MIDSKIFQRKRNILNDEIILTNGYGGFKKKKKKSTKTFIKSWKQKWEEKQLYGYFQQQTKQIAWDNMAKKGAPDERNRIS